MPSPFPGMDPYLEPGLWRDFHAVFVVYARETLTRLLPRPDVARIHERDSCFEMLPPDAIVLEEPRETFVNVYHWPDRSLVTVVELLSGGQGVRARPVPDASGRLARQRGERH